MKIELDMKFVSLNEYIESERRNRYAGAAIKKQQTNSVCLLAKKNKISLKKGLYNVKFTWIKPDNKKDHDNICFAKKFILDGLVQAGIIENDTCKYIGNFIDVFVLDRSKKYISCIVEFI